MRHFHRTHIPPADVLSVADAFFTKLGLEPAETTARGRIYSGPLGSMTLTARPEGGHYTFVEVHTDQIDQSRLDRNVKAFFVEVHRAADPSHKLQADY
jgi:hypothetical protein